MEFIIVTHQELCSLSGLPYLQQLVYLQGIKPYVDYKTGLVGIRRGISYQSLGEALYIEPHSGVKSGSPSKDQLRRSLKKLEDVGLIEIESWKRKLVLRCLLLDRDKSVQKQLATNPPYNLAINIPQKKLINSEILSQDGLEPAPSKDPQPATPQEYSNNYYSFTSLSEGFEEFWQLYPLKKEKQNAFTIFKKLKPSQDLIAKIISCLQEQIQHYQHQVSGGAWMPDWKYPANWLTQRCWEEKLIINPIVNAKKEYQDEVYARGNTKQSNKHDNKPTESDPKTGFSEADFRKLWK